jgi:PIN domain nuclease of toxin-antitoxin system
VLEPEGFAALPITWQHAARAGALPPHHSDPFDRMLVAQALVEGFTLISRDGRLAPYGVKVLRA